MNVSCSSDDIIRPPFKVVARVKSIKGECAYGMKVGDTFEVTGFNKNAMKGLDKVCPSALSDGLWRYMYAMAFGANLSHTNIVSGSGKGETERSESCCTDPYNSVVFEITREKQKTSKVNI